MVKDKYKWCMQYKRDSEKTSHDFLTISLSIECLWVILIKTNQMFFCLNFLKAFFMFNFHKSASTVYLREQNVGIKPISFQEIPI